MTFERTNWYCPKCDKTYDYIGITFEFPGIEAKLCGVCWVKMMKQFCGEMVKVEEKPDKELEKK